MAPYLKLVRSGASKAELRLRPPALRVLVAEDDPQMRRFVANALRKDGYDVLEVADSTQLLAELVLQDLVNRDRPEPVDLIVTDMSMPGCRALSILEVLREAEWHTPMILMTAFGDRETRDRADKVGAVLLDKPFRLEVLLAAVRMCLL